MNALARLYTSTAALYARFGLDATSVPPAKRRRIFMEEVLELVEASTEDGIDPPFDATVNSEAADVLVTILGLLQAHGISLERFEAECERVAAKNDAKTHDTHALMNGKITRKPAAAQEAL